MINLLYGDLALYLKAKFKLISHHSPNDPETLQLRSIVQSTNNRLSFILSHQLFKLIKYKTNCLISPYR